MCDPTNRHLYSNVGGPLAHASQKEVKLHGSAVAFAIQPLGCMGALDQKRQGNRQIVTPLASTAALRTYDRLAKAKKHNTFRS